MSIKPSFQGAIIYLGMVFYGLGLVSWFLGRHRGSKRWMFAGFVAAGSALIYRWIHTGHVPMQNLFEVFLWLGMLVYPIHAISTDLLGCPSSLAADLSIGLLALFPAGFVFADHPQALPAALQSPFFIPHVAMYMISYVLMAKAGYWAVVQLISNRSGIVLEAERASHIMVCAGLPFMTGGLLLGSIWGHYAWGNWWGWDPKELWSLVCWLVYVLYLHLRPRCTARWTLVCPGLVLVGLFFILITLLWVNLSRLFSGLHSYAV